MGPGCGLAVCGTTALAVAGRFHHTERAQGRLAAWAALRGIPVCNVWLAGLAARWTCADQVPTRSNEATTAADPPTRRGSAAPSPVAGPQRLHGNGAHGTPASQALVAMAGQQRGACEGSRSAAYYLKIVGVGGGGGSGGRAPKASAARRPLVIWMAHRHRPRAGRNAPLPRGGSRADTTTRGRAFGAPDPPPSSGLRRAAALKCRGAVAEASTAAASPAPRAAARARRPARRPARRIVEDGVIGECRGKGGVSRIRKLFITNMLRPPCSTKGRAWLGLGSC